MNFIHRATRFLQKVARGQDVLLAPQTKEQWERQFEKGEWSRLREGQPNTEAIARLVEQETQTSERPLQVLDVGCGNGGLSRLIGRAPDRIAYCGIDISEKAIEQARLLAPEGEYRVLDAEQPPSDLGTFDVIVFNEILYYLAFDSVLPKYRAYARPGARVIISIVRSWRSTFIWNRINRHVRCLTRYRIHAEPRSGVKRMSWDLVLGTFTSASS